MVSSHSTRGPIGRRALSRRGLMGAGAATLLAACSDQDSPATAPSASSPGTPVASATTSPATTGSHGLTGASESSDSSGAGPHTPSTTSSTPGSSPTASPTGHADLPDREQVIRKWQGRRPTQWSTTATGVVTHLGNAGPQLALTFDLCGGPRPGSPGNGYDTALIGFLRRHRVPATLFLNSRWIMANRAAAESLIADPLFEIGNHGTRHLPMSVTGRSAYGQHGTTSVAQVYDEVAGNTALLTSMMGQPPRWFRGGTAWYDDVAVRIIEELGQRVVGFSINGDAGATYSSSRVAASLTEARHSDIVISHANRPGSGTAAGYAQALPQLLQRLHPVPLSAYLKPPRAG